MQDFLVYERCILEMFASKKLDVSSENVQVDMDWLFILKLILLSIQKFENRNDFTFLILIDKNECTASGRLLAFRKSQIIVACGWN